MVIYCSRISWPPLTPRSSIFDLPILKIRFTSPKLPFLKMLRGFPGSFHVKQNVCKLKMCQIFLESPHPDHSFCYAKKIWPHIVQICVMCSWLFWWNFHHKLIESAAIHSSNILLYNIYFTTIQCDCFENKEYFFHILGAQT